jgi:hypothetical protein
MVDLCARHGTRELGVIRDFIARIHQGVDAEIRASERRNGNTRALALRASAVSPRIKSQAWPIPIT